MSESVSICGGREGRGGEGRKGGKIIGECFWREGRAGREVRKEECVCVFLFPIPSSNIYPLYRITDLSPPPIPSPHTPSPKPKTDLPIPQGPRRRRPCRHGLSPLPLLRSLPTFQPPNAADLRRPPCLPRPLRGINYFSSLKYFCPEHYNPADFYLKLISFTPGGEVGREGARMDLLSESFQRSAMSVRKPLMVDNKHKGLGGVHGIKASTWTLLKLNFWRSSLRLRRDKTFVVLWGVISVIVVFCWGLFICSRRIIRGGICWG